MNRGKVAIWGFAAGATFMYFADPDRGRRRRALLRDKGTKNWNRFSALLDKGRRDFANRAGGAISGVRGILGNNCASDEILVERVRSSLGRVVSHPHAIEAGCRNGRIVLKGPVLDSEVDSLLRAVESVAGVSEVVNELRIHRESDHIPSLQGGRRREMRSEFAQQSWTPALRLAAGGLGAGLTLYGAIRRGIVGFAGRMTGSALMLRAITNRQLRDVIGSGDGARVIALDKAIHIHAPVSEVFNFWADHRRLPRFMTHLCEVRDIGEGRTHWVAEGPGGIPVSWDAELTGYIQDKLLSWRSLPGSMVETEGIVRFEQEDGGCCVSVRMFYKPPAGVLGHYIASLFGADPKSEMDDDMGRMKSLIELGRTHAHGERVTRDSVRSASASASTVYTG